MVLYPRQREYLAWRQARIDAHEDGLVEKSRDVGLTWLNVGSQLHQWLFTPDFSGGFGSATELKLDRIGDPDSILEKGRILLRRLPKWMLPDGFDDRKHCGHLKFINPATASTVTGESGDNIGRGGRSVVYDVDEGAFLEHAGAAEAALSQNTDTVIWTSTVNGVGNLFHAKRFSLPEHQVFVYDWRDDPKKAQAWYDLQAERFKHNPALLASEVDRDYSASVEGTVIPGIWVQAAINADEKLRLTRDGGIYAAADIAAGGANKTVFGARQQGIVFGLRESNESNTTTNAHNLAAFTAEAAASVLRYDAVGLGIGVKSTFELLEDPPFRTEGILGGESPSEMKWPDGKTSKEMFLNRRAELYWLLRLRFERTYEAVNGIAEYEPEDLISIPFHSDMIAQLSIPKKKTTLTGKIAIESKDEMRKRGVGSPDWADMLAYLFSPDARVRRAVPFKII